MPAPIKLGSALGTQLIFEKGSKVTTSPSGIQSSSIQALCPDGANVFGFLPAAGATFNNVFGNNYLPSTFKVDYTGGGADIEYIEGKAARVTINFKRPDPNRVQGRAGAKISVDSAINYKSLVNDWSVTPLYYSAAGDLGSQNLIGFPEPIVSVVYVATTPPPVAGGTIGALYASPDDPRSAGFPSLNQIRTPFKVGVPAGSTVTYWNNTAYVTVGPTTRDEFFNFTLNFDPNRNGWKLDKLKYDPQADSTFYDVEETWRGQYFFSGVTFINISYP